MSRRIRSLGVALLFLVSACADIWQFQDFEAARDAAADDAGVDSTLADGPNPVEDAEASVDRGVSVDADAGGADIGRDSGGSGDEGMPVDAAQDQAAPVCPATCPTGATCDNGVCVCRDAPNMCATACVDFQTDPNHCGSCTGVCPSGASCIAGVCGCPVAQPSMCAGTCVDTKSDHANCGGCGTSCPAMSACHNGACTKCGSFATDGMCGGVCADESSDAKNCGACGHACANGASCVAGVCTCPPGDPTTCAAAATDAGACVDTVTDHNNCGGCGNVCKLAHATSGCTSKSCVVLSCTTGYTDCNKIASDGCEIHTTSDPSNCNGCGSVCTVAHATASCTNSSCTVQACATGYGNCDGVESNGCEVDTRTSAANCGACSTAAASRACTGGKVCVSSACTCSAGTHDCSGTCVSDKSTSITSCGTSCAPCAAPTNGTATCTGAAPVCGKVCDKVAYPTLCGSACVNTMTDKNNCGGCGAVFACPSGTTCVAGACTTGMDAGTIDASDDGSGDVASASDATGE